MTHAPYLREKAREMRRERELTIDELSERLGLSRSTVYYWVRDMPIARSGGGWPTTAQRSGNRAMRRKYRALREAAYEAGAIEFARLGEDPTFRDFVCLYLAEGYKRNRNVVSVCNSDPAIVRLCDRWIRRFAVNKVSYSLQYHADQSVAELRRFWGDWLAIDPEAVRLQRKSNSGQLARRTWRCRHGVLTVGTNDTLFRARLEAWMNGVRATWV